VGASNRVTKRTEMKKVCIWTYLTLWDTVNKLKSQKVSVPLQICWHILNGNNKIYKLIKNYILDLKKKSY